MPIFIYDSFLIDLRENGDGSFAQRVLRKVLTSSAEFRADSDDHRYHGIDDAWIRYVSMGKAGFRVIYLRRGDQVYLYRAGVHAIEDNLSAPGSGAVLVAVNASNLISTSSVILPERVSNKFLQNGRKRQLRHFLLGRRLMPHRDVLLISPYVSLPLLVRSSRVGQALDDLIEDGTKVTLITRWPIATELGSYRELEVRGFSLLFHRSLHAKLYIFTVRAVGGKKSEHYDAAVIGSANLTEKGFGFDERNFNEELCYELPEAAYEGAMEFACQLASEADDLIRVRRELTARR